MTRSVDDHDEVAGQAVGPDAADQDEEDLGDPDGGEDHAEVRGRAVQVVEDCECKRDRGERAAEERCSAAEEEEAERALAERAEAAHAARSRRFSAQRRIPRYECQNGIACAYDARCSGGSGADLGLALLDEGVLLGACLDLGRPALDALPELGQMAAGVIGDAEVHERKPLRCPPLDLVQRLEPRVSVELGRRRGREDELARLDADAGRVACVEHPLGVEVADVVSGMARRREAVEAEHAIADHADVRLGDGRELAPELVEEVAVEAARAFLEPGRVDEVRRADRRDVDGQARMLAARGRRRRPRGRGGCARAAGAGCP